MALKLNSNSTYLARKASEYTYDWEITGYTSVPSFKIYSPEPGFIAGSNHENKDCQWLLNLQHDQNRLFVTLSLEPINAIQFQSVTEMHIIVSIVTEDGVEVNHQEKQIVIEYSISNYKYFQTGTCFNWFVKKDDLFNQKHRLLVDGKWTIRCRLYFFPDSSQGTYKATKINLEESIEQLSILECHTIGSNNFEKLFESKAHSDVKLVVQDEEFHAHKCILAAHSRVFSAMFEHDMRESRENVVKITDVEAEIMKELLRFVYTSKVQNLETMVEDLLATADKYEIEGLKVLCGQVYVKTLNIDNVGELLQLANKYRVSSLKTQALKLILNYQNCANRETLKEGAESVSFSLLDFINALVEFKKY